ncbi:uncharacterized protein DNG_10214 [Cephalotrichum gorgonifer]|uniref:Uncharacterized protein n=1 Tax=Cephalotrichum gorgonifer TaxID=2041049 RepID=A0AAE8N767_9PEZI|nr:uncharacterized protein DNG_10214 [Cephalotrichum gorgonifer]
MQNPDIEEETPQTRTGFIYRWQLCHLLAVEYNLVPPRADHNAADVALTELHTNAAQALNHSTPLKKIFSKMPRGLLAWFDHGTSSFLISIEPETPQKKVLSKTSTMIGLFGSVRSLESTVKVLTFFCGRHTADGATFQGGSGLMRALTLQLVSIIPIPLVPLPKGNDQSDVVKQLEAGDLEMIFSVFTTALEQLSEDITVFVLIHGAANWNSTEDRRGGICTVVQSLREEVMRLRNVNRGPWIKVLVTNPSSDQTAEWSITEEDIIRLDG